jgi:hypothetical protein
MDRQTATRRLTCFVRRPMEHLRPEQFMALANPGVTSLQLLLTMPTQTRAPDPAFDADAPPAALRVRSRVASQRVR